MKTNKWSHCTTLLLFVLAAPLWAGVSNAVVKFSDVEANDQHKQNILAKVTTLRIPFIANEGQVANEVGFYAKTFSGTIYVTKKGEMVYSLTKKEQSQAHTKENKDNNDPKIQVCVLKEQLLKARNVLPKGVENAVTRINYFIGGKDNWKTNIPSYNRVDFGEVYNHIDLSLKAHGNNVEKIFTVHPKGKVEQIQLSMEGALSLAVNAKGELEVDVGAGTVNFSAPIAFQKVVGKQRKIEIAYVVKNKTYGFKVGEYNRELPLIIDPTLAYSTFLGGSAIDEGNSIAVDSGGYVYVTGYTQSTNFPIASSPFQGIHSGGINDVFVTKINTAGDYLVYSTYLGGSSSDRGNDIVVDGTGNAYVTGQTQSTNFPTVSPIQGTLSGTSSAFITKLHSTGSSLIYSTYLGGSGWDTA